MNGSLIIGIVVAIILIVVIVKVVRAIIEKRWQEEEIQRNSDLLDAVKRSDMKTVQRLVEEGADIYHEHGAILLENAIRNCNKEIISFLLDKGVDVNFVYEGRVPLACANDEEIIALLKNRGAKTKSDLDEAKREREREAKKIQEAAKKDKETWEARQREEAARREEQEREAREKEEAAIKQRIENQNILNENLIDAINHHDIEKVKSLISQGADVNFSYKIAPGSLVTPLICAITVVDIGIVKLLVNKGANVDRKVYIRGIPATALQYSQGIGNEDIADFLKYGV